MQRFLHATSSATLVGLAHSEFKLCSVENLIQVYGITPMAGEISLGGQQGAAQTAFAHYEDSYWNFDVLLGSYAQGRPYSRLNSEEAIIQDVEKQIKKNLTFIRETTIHLMRQRHMGTDVPLKEETAVSLCQSLDEAVKRILQYYIRNYIVVTYLRPGVLTGLNAVDIQIDFINYFVKYIPIDFLDKTEEEQKTFLESLKGLFADWTPTFINEKPKSFNFSDYFTVIELTSQYTGKEKFLYRSALDRALSEPQRRDFIDFYFYPEDVKNQYEVDRKQLADLIKIAYGKVTKEVGQLKKALVGKEVLEFSTEEKALCESTFPLIFIIEDSPGTENALLEQLKYEYRAKKDLTLGVEIKQVAVPADKIHMIRDYFHKRGLTGVEVISIESLNPNTKQTAPNALFNSGNDPSGPLSQIADVGKISMQRQSF
ncbi:MAG: hypothetical protein AB7F64_01980 [Gammaproteobacteria bacterium]